MVKGLVSIVIPTYNGSDKVAKAAKSVLNQTYDKVEVIVVDDNGLGTEEQIKTKNAVKELECYDNFKYITHAINKNGSAARNTGARAADGEFIGFLDDDDEFYPHKIAMQMEEYEKYGGEYALTYCSFEEYRNDQLVRVGIKKYSGSLLYEVLRHKAVIGSSCLIMTKEAFDKVGGFDESFRRHQDWEFTARVAANYKVKAIEEVGFRRNLEYRNSPKDYETAKKYRVHYIEKMMPYIKMLSRKQQKKVINSNYVSVMMQLLRTGKIGKFIKEYRSFKLGLCGIPFVLKSMFSYVFINKNFWTLRKRK